MLRSESKEPENGKNEEVYDELQIGGKKRNLLLCLILGSLGDSSFLFYVK